MTKQAADTRDDLSPRLVRLAGWTAIAATLVGMAADLCLLYAPRGGYGAGDCRFMADIPARRRLWGHNLGVLAIPWQAAGRDLHGKSPSSTGRPTVAAPSATPATTCAGVCRLR